MAPFTIDSGTYTPSCLVDDLVLAASGWKIRTEQHGIGLSGWTDAIVSANDGYVSTGGRGCLSDNENDFLEIDLGHIQEVIGVVLRGNSAGYLTKVKFKGSTNENFDAY
jgi:hypothetical protein